jgi:Type IV secretion-system coupling protein DNA-binding domain
MFGFSKLHTGLIPRRHPGAAIAAGFLMFALTALPCAAAIVLLAKYDGAIDWSFVSAHLATMPIAKIGHSILRHWHDLALGIVIAMVATWFAAMDAWRETPTTEPFDTPDPADPRVYYDGDARAKLRSSFLAEAGGFPKKGVWLAPYLNLPFALETRNLLVAAASGHGKSNIVRALAGQAILRGDRTVLHCSKGDVTRSFNTDDVILISPAHRDGWAWDIAADIDGPAAAAEFARDVIPASDQPFWSDTARLVLADTIAAIAEEKGDKWGPLELLLTLLSSTGDLYAKIAKLDLSSSPLLASAEDGDTDRTVQGIMSTLLSAALTTLRPMAMAWSTLPPEKHFSVKRWLSKNYTSSNILIVQTSPNFEAMSTSVCGGILRRICKAVSDPSMEIDPSRRTSFFLDEFYSLGRIEGIGKALSVAREKGLICVISVQSMQQLRLIYQDEAELMSDLFQIKIYGRLTAGQGAEDTEKTMRYRQIRWQAWNSNPAHDDKRRYVTKEETKPIVSATQLSRDLGLFEGNTPREYIRAVVHYAGAAHRLDWPATKWAVKGDGFVPAAWTQFLTPPAP